MPLLPGKSNIGQNIQTETAAGKPRKQAIAIALNEARQSGAKIPPPKGGFASSRMPGIRAPHLSGSTPYSGLSRRTFGPKIARYGSTGFPGGDNNSY